MALKLMIFIDGSWLFLNRNQIANSFNKPNFKIDYRKLPQVIERQLSSHLNSEVHTVRTHFFGSIPINKPDFDPTLQNRFYDYLQKECRYSMEIYEIDFKNSKDFPIEEKCVDVALASCMMFYAAIPHAYDVAALVGGDADYLPLIKRIRALGKQTLLAAFKSIGESYPTSRKLMEDYSLFDFPVIYLEDYLRDITLQRKERLRICDNCKQQRLTSWEGEPFYCDECRLDFAKSRKISTRTCEGCGQVEESTYLGDQFFCSECRK